MPATAIEQARKSAAEFLGVEAPSEVEPELRRRLQRRRDDLVAALHEQLAQPAACENVHKRLQIRQYLLL